MKRAPPSESGGGDKAARMELAGMQRYLVTVEYDGTRFSGWQRQDGGGRTVQGTLETALSKFVGHPVTSAGSSRTDAGVHALGNVCHVDVVRTSKRKPGEVLAPHSPEVLVRAVNHFLLKDGAADLQLLHSKLVPAHFHARFNATGRTYHYRILAGGPASLFERDRAWNVPENLDLSVMQKASQVLVGNHDFSSFRASGCQANSPVRTLDELSVCEVPSWPNFPRGARPSHGRIPRQSYLVTARAQSFLYHQVRLMVGALKAAGSGKLSVQQVQDILDARSITAAPPMAPACGLYLASVDYGTEVDKKQDEQL